MIKTYIHAIILFFVLAVTAGAQHNSLRIVRYTASPPVPDAFFERARDANYTHVQLPISSDDIVPSQWNAGEYVCPVSDANGLRTRLRDAFIRAHAYNLEIIPEIAGGNRHSGLWQNTNNTAIRWEPLLFDKVNDQAFQELMENEAIYLVVTTGLLGQFFAPLLSLVPAVLSNLGPASTGIVTVGVAAGVLIGLLQDGGAFAASGCPVYAHNPDGFSKSYRSMVDDVVRAAFDDYKTATGQPGEELDYYHMTYDEPVYFSFDIQREKKLLIGKSQEDLKWMYDECPNNGGVSRMSPTQDQQDLYNNNPNLQMGIDVTYYYYASDFDGEDYKEAIRRLFADAVSRRVQDIKEFLPNTQVLMYGDMFDPQHYGGYADTYETISLLQNADVLVNGVTEPLTDHLILVQWQYLNTYTHDLEADVTSADIEGVSGAGQVLSAASCFACPLLGFPPFVNACLAGCTGGIVASTVPNSVSIGLTMSATGQKYDVSATFNHFIAHGFRFIYVWGYDKGYPFLYSHTLSPGYNSVNAVNALSAVNRATYALGYGATPWTDWGEAWDPNVTDQSPIFNSIEILASANNSDPGFNTIAMGGNVCLVPALRAMCDMRVTNQVNYLDINRNLFDNDPCNSPMEPRQNVSWFDAVLYCNRLSQREGLTQFYTITPVYRGDPGTGILENGTLVALNQSADGYRLPTPAEYFHLFNNQATIPGCVAGAQEWVCPMYSGNAPQTRMAIGGTGVVQSVSINADAMFRVVRSIPCGNIQVTGVIPQNTAYVAGGNITFVNAVQNNGSVMSASSGTLIRLSPATALRGEARMVIDPSLRCP